MRGALTFKQRDVTRALKAAEKADQHVIGFEITKAGNIFVHTSKAERPSSTARDWDEALSNDR